MAGRAASDENPSTWFPRVLFPLQSDVSAAPLPRAPAYLYRKGRSLIQTLPTVTSGRTFGRGMLCLCLIPPPAHGMTRRRSIALSGP